MLPAEETTLAILKARLEAMPKTDRWYPVLVRYISQVAGRVDGLGGNADGIPPSLGGYRPVRRPCEEHLEEFTGKVCEVVFNCFGEFVGFVMDDCCQRRAFENCKRDDRRPGPARAEGAPHPDGRHGRQGAPDRPAGSEGLSNFCGEAL